MTVITAENLPWVLISVLFTALVAVFYAMLRGNILSGKVAELVRQSAEKRAEIAEQAAAANTKSVESLGDSVAKLLVLAENQDKVLRALRQHVDRDQTGRRGGSS